MRPSLIVRRVHPVLIICGDKQGDVIWHLPPPTGETINNYNVLTFLWRSDGDGLCRELLVKVACVRL